MRLASTPLPSFGLPVKSGHNNVAGVGEGPGQAVELGDDEGVTRAEGGEPSAQNYSSAVVLRSRSIDR